MKDNDLIYEAYLNEGLGVGSGHGFWRGKKGHYDPDADTMTGTIEDIANDIRGLRSLHHGAQDAAREKMKMRTRGFLGKNPDMRDQVRKMLQQAIAPDGRSRRFSEDDVKDILGERPQGPLSQRGGGAATYKTN